MGVAITPGQCIGLIPARGGSKSIRLKNLVPIGGVPMMGYVIAAARGCEAVLDRVVCSTDHAEIAKLCRANEVDVDPRPEELCGDDAAVADVVREMLHRWVNQGQALPEVIVLLQPTNPFVLPEHIERLTGLLLANPDADTAQTITQVPHNLHSFNQRTLIDGRVAFNMAAERKSAYNKQRKPKLYQFGNLVAFRSASILAGQDCFGDVSVGFEIERNFAFDVDGPEDLNYAEFLVKENRVPLPPLGLLAK